MKMNFVRLFYHHGGKGRGINIYKTIFKFEESGKIL
jgi:hypothetical protein